MSEARAGSGSIARATTALIWREVLLLVRRPSRVVATILTPALFWAFFALGFTDAIAGEASPGSGDAYTVSLAAGAALLVATFTSIFGALGLIRDRETGFLQGVLVGPTPRSVVIVARVVSGSVFAFLQALVLLIASAFLVDGINPIGITLSGGAILLAAVGLSGLCTGLAWHFRSIEGFHGIMSGVLVPGWLLSGAVFPPGVSGGVLGVILTVNPLAHAHDAIFRSLAVGTQIDSGDGLLRAAAMVAAFAAFGLVFAVLSCRGDAKR